mmetsp:Transcript_35192/g.48079  ORF Transcript_35192/g.48079 Transcript_35192/m.48079 type:complete len:198 (+) Transcript_35192:69-662(+)|eukprot:CAMPEP_0201478064 /NCGR_PEP_ID=MMETSP0151_2-20130828/2986_1 /ASSEMBLY_ACC=CAM_ASM_000257 /TAXON_ID=200890 /ORGANISM="Paramoeba atlantica, Strain 621/1 / CCAP 1560/9" /LENGTH=197 /DNA_ID=CAMNT_0047859009 /DNA_START=47 /DNA_END=640 /DNA_ORIENTATION=-
MILLFQFLLAAVLCTGVSAKEKRFDAEITDKVFLDIQIGDRRVRRITIGLFGKEVPKTVENFKQLCNHTQGYGYRNSIFHRVIKKFMIQGGDFTHNDGTGGYSIYGESFKDENFNISHFKGCLSMANAGANTNGSQFIIATTETYWLNGQHVVFGKVLEGFGLVKDIARLKTLPGDRPEDEDARIVDCGILEEGLRS